MTSRMAFLIGALAICLFSCAALATDRFFPDCTATSANGFFRIDAKSPDNAGPQPRPFAENFTYTLTDTRTGNIVWQRKQPMTRTKGSALGWSAEGSPMGVFVDDSGLVAARVSSERIVFLAAADGTKLGEVPILESFPTEEQESYVSETTAGPMWSQYSRWSFVSTPADDGETSKTYFVLRPFWGHRLIMDPAAAKLVDAGEFHSVNAVEQLSAAPAHTARLMSAILTAEFDFCLKNLAAAAAKLPEGDRWGSADGALKVAINLAGHHQLRQAIPDLRVLESTLSIEVGGDAQWRRDNLLREVRTALRRLGETPIAGAGVRLHQRKQHTYSIVADFDKPLLWSVPVEDRAANAPTIEVGMTTREMTDLIGCPDARVFDNGQCYDYDIDGSDPHTLRIMLDNSDNRIATVRRIRPPAYLTGFQRESSY